MSLNRRIRKLKETRAAVLDSLQDLPPEKLVARPRADKWSILEIVEHIALAEREVLRGLPDPALLVGRPRRLKHRVRYLLVLSVLKARIPVRAPSPAMLPQGGLDLEEVRRLWDEGQQWLQSYGDGLDAAGRRRAVFRHPVAGPLTVAQAIQLNQIHIDGHARQIRRLRRLLAG